MKAAGALMALAVCLAVISQEDMVPFVSMGLSKGRELL